MHRKKVLLVLNDLAGGGEDRVATLLLEHLDRGRFEPLLVLLEDRRDYATAEDVPITCLHKKSRYDLPRLIWRLARIYEKGKPDVVLGISSYLNLLTVLARKLSRVKPKLLLSEHMNISISFRYEPLSRVKAWAIPRLYPQSDAVIAVSRGVAGDLVANFGVPHEKTKVIYNPVDIDHILTLARENVDHPWFAHKESPIVIAVGRLTAQKGYPHLLRAFAQVTERFPCRLVILGEGEERHALEALAQQLGVGKGVAFLGFQQNPFRYLARSDVFALSSLWEGLALVVIEAMACGVPVIGTRCPSGPDEIITDGVNGLLVPVADEAAMAEAILQLLNDKDFAIKLAQAGRKRAEDFVARKRVAEYEQLISTITSSL